MTAAFLYAQKQRRDIAHAAGATPLTPDTYVVSMPKATLSEKSASESNKSIAEPVVVVRLARVVVPWLTLHFSLPLSALNPAAQPPSTFEALWEALESSAVDAERHHAFLEEQIKQVRASPWYTST